MFGKKKKVLEEEPVNSKVQDVGIGTEVKPISPPMPPEPSKFQETPQIPQQQQVQQPVQQPTQQQAQQQPVKLTAEEEAMIQLIKDYKKYTTVFSPTDMANMPCAVKDAEQFNLQFSIFSELRGVRQDLGVLSNQLSRVDKKKK